MLVAHAAVVLPEGNVEDPMQGILDRPVLADGSTEDNRIVTTARQKVADLGFDFGSAVGAAQRLDGKNGAQTGPSAQGLKTGRLGAGKYPSTNQAAMRLVEEIGRAHV